MPLDGRRCAAAAARGGPSCAWASSSAAASSTGSWPRSAKGRPVTVACTQEAPLFAQEAEAAGSGGAARLRQPARTRRLVGRGRRAPGRRWPRCWPPPPCRCRRSPLVPLEERGHDAGARPRRGGARRRRAAARPARPDGAADRRAAGGAAAQPPITRSCAAAPAPPPAGSAPSRWWWTAMPPPPRPRAPPIRWGAARDGARSRCDLILDLSGGPPLFPARGAPARLPARRPGRRGGGGAGRRSTPPGWWASSTSRASWPSTPALCAHRRNRRTGCTRCLDLCPTGAIAPGTRTAWRSRPRSAPAAAPAPPSARPAPPPTRCRRRPPRLARLRALLLGFAEAGGRDPLVLLHDEAHGEALLHALARHGDGLPARVLPLRVNEVSQLDLGALAAALAWGAAGLRAAAARAAAARRRRRVPQPRLPGGGPGGPRPGGAAGGAAARGRDRDRRPVLPGRGAGSGARAPHRLGAGVLSAAGRAARDRARRAPGAARRGRPRRAARSCRCRRSRPSALARVETAGCTLCLACTTVCPTGAFSANPERAGAALPGGRLRAVRPVRRDLPGAGDRAGAAAELRPGARRRRAW